MLKVKRPADDPNHWCIGRFWSFQPFGKTTPQVYFCESHVENYGFWMINVADVTDRRNVSERAPHRTYHQVCNPAEEYVSPSETRRWNEAVELFEKNVKPILEQLDPYAETRFAKAGA